MKILITGATGLVGSDLMELCLKEGLEVNFLTTRKEKLVFNDRARGFLWNPLKGEIDTACFEGVTAIVNLAGAPIAKRWSKSYKEQILNSRLQSLRTLHRGLQEHGINTVDHFISASAIGIYPDSLTTFYTEDETGKAEGFAADVVNAWEEEVERFKDIVPNVAILRIGLVLSDEGGALVKMAQPVKMYSGAAFGSGEHWQSWIHIRDLSRMLLFISEHKLNGVFNAVAPNPVTQNKLIKELAKVLKRPILLPNIPKVILQLMFGEMSSILTASQRVSSKKIESKGFHFKYQNICRALEGIYQGAELQ